MGVFMKVRMQCAWAYSLEIEADRVQGYAVRRGVLACFMHGCEKMKRVCGTSVNIRQVRQMMRVHEWPLHKTHHPSSLSVSA